jgi:DNA-binding CsgD family transcriptional regulator
MVGRRRTAVLVGRRAELDLLDAGLAAVRRGSGQIYLVSGDAGIGKSRLIEEFANRNDDVRVFTGHCVNASTDALAYAPWSELLWYLVREVGADALGEQRAALSRFLPEIDLTDRDDVGGSKELLFEALIEALARTAATRPLVIVLEDIHWIDAASRDVLLAVVRNQRRLPMLVIATHRPSSTPELADLTGNLAREGATSIRLRALPDEAAADVAAQLTGRDADDSDVRNVVERADGNPLFLEELVAALGDSKLPDSIRHLLLGRFSALDRDGQHVVRVAAAIGLHVPRAWLANASALSPADCRAATRAAVDSGVLIASNDRRGYAFAHSLLRDAILDELLPDELTELHEAAANALEQHPIASDELDIVAELGRHWDAAEVPDKALQWTSAAADQAARRYAFASALALYRRALLWWDAVDDPETRADRTHAQLLLDAADAAGEAGAATDAAFYASRAVAEEGAGRAIETFPRAHPHLWAARRADELYKLSAVALQQADTAEPHAELRFLVEYATFLVFDGQPELAVEFEERIAALMQQVDDADLVAHAHLVFGWCFETVGDAARAEAEFLAGIQTAQREDLRHVQALISYNYASFLSIYSRHADSLEQLTRTQASIKEFGLYRLRVAIPTLQAENMSLLGDLHGATAALDSCAGYAVDGIERAVYLYNRALIEIFSGGDLVFGRECTELPTAPVDIQRMLQRAFVRVELLARRGELREAVACVFEALDEIRNQSEIYCFGFLAASGMRVIADLATSRNEPTIDLPARGRAEQLISAWRDAVGRLHASFAIVDAQSASIDAEFARITGDEPVTAAARASEAFDAINMPYYVAYWQWRQAEAMLRKRSKNSPVPLLTSARKIAIRHGFAGLEGAIDGTARAEQLRLGARGNGSDELLSPREVEVLRLLSEGRSNPEIADQLIIGRRTVRTHVSHILQKLGASSRGEAVAVARKRAMI